MSDTIAEVAAKCNEAERALAYHCAELTISEVQAVRRAGDRDAAVFVHAGQVMFRMPEVLDHPVTIKHLDVLYLFSRKFQPHVDEDMDAWIEQTTCAFLRYAPRATKAELNAHLLAALQEQEPEVFRAAEQVEKNKTAAHKKDNKWDITMDPQESGRLWDHVTKDAKQRAKETGEELDVARAKIIIDRLSGKRSNSVVHVHVFRTLGGGWIPGVGTISEEEADRLQQNADHVDYPEKPADVDGYRPSQAQRVWVMARDKTCRFPGCDYPAHRCDLDHIQEYNHDNPAAGGATSVDNLQCLCRYHHNLKTNKVWSAHRVVWTKEGFKHVSEVEDPT